MNDIVKNLLWKHFTALAVLGSAVIVACVASMSPLLVLSEKSLQALSAFSFAWAGIARLSWNQGSYKTNTLPERAERWIFLTLCWVGANTLTVTYL